MIEFNYTFSSENLITEAGEKFFLALYGVKGYSVLDIARSHIYLTTIARQKISSTFNSAVLPLTSDRYRSGCTEIYCQQNGDGHELMVSFSQFQTTTEVVPENLLKLAICKKIVNASCEKNCECKKS